MSTVHLTIWGTIAALVLFIGIGLALVVSALRSDAAREQSGDDSPIGRRGPREAVRRYVGPVDRSHALLNPPLRVLLELVCASCGIPGLGWMTSARVAIGLPMLCIAPSIIYGFYPVYLTITGHFLDSPYVALRYLPYLGVISATALAIAEWRELKAS